MANEPTDTTEKPTDPIDSSAPVDVQEPDLETKVVQRIAKGLGWVPKDEWRGDEGDWKPAEEFLPSIRDHNKSLQSQMRDLARTTTKMIAQNKAEAEARAAQMVADAKMGGDPDLIEQAVEHQARVKTTDASSSPANDPAVIKFKSDNASWLGPHKLATAVAMAAAQEGADNGLSNAEQVREAEKAVRKAYPELFPKAQAPRTPPLMADGSRVASTSARKKGVADLPAEARKAGEMFVKRGMVKSLDQYATTFFEQQENA